MRVLVTGASGFLGTAVVDRLCTAGHVVVAMVRPAARLGSPACRSAYEAVRRSLRTTVSGALRR